MNDSEWDEWDRRAETDVCGHAKPGDTPDRPPQSRLQEASWVVMSLDPLTSTETPPAEPLPLRVRATLSPRTSSQTKKQPPYAVVLHNDPINRFEWVIGVLIKVLRCGGGRAFWLVLKTHVGGRGSVWSGSLEVAELKAEQIRGEGPDPRKVAAGARPLKVTVEQLPG